jgi:hypothetical protein
VSHCIRNWLLITASRRRGPAPHHPHRAQKIRLQNEATKFLPMNKTAPKTNPSEPINEATEPILRLPQLPRSTSLSDHRLTLPT